MVIVESYAIDGAKDFNQFSCGSCGRYHEDEEEAEECCNVELFPHEEEISEQEPSRYDVEAEIGCKSCCRLHRTKEEAEECCSKESLAKEREIAEKEKREKVEEEPSEYEILQKDRERIKETFSKLLKKYIDRRQKTAKNKQTKGTLPVNELKRLEKEFLLNVDDQYYEQKWHY